MTRLQRRVLLYVQSEQDQGRYVSVREVVERFGLSSTAQAHDVMRRLIDLGYLTKAAGKARSYRVVRRAEPVTVWLVWDERTQVLVSLRDRRAA